VGLAAILIPLNALWIIVIEQVWGNIFSTTLSLFFNVVISLLLVIALNAALRRWAPRQALTPAELAAIYSMLAVSAAIGGLDAIQILVPVMTHGYRFATPSNHWDELFHAYLPRWLTVADPEALDGLYNGYSTLYTAGHLHAWAIPVLGWLGFIGAMLLVFLCLGAVLRKQWTEHERLTYPVVQLPLALIQNPGGLTHSRLFWIGALAAGSLDLLSGLARLYPSLPSVSLIGYDISPFFTELPWRELGWTPISIYPFVIGLGFLLPVDLLLSCWFFHLVWKSQKVVAGAMGYGPIPSFPDWIDQQTLGAYLGVAVTALWKARSYLRRVFRQAAGYRGALSEESEPMSYRMALLGIGVGFSMIVGFCWLAGMQLWAAVLFFGLFFVIAIALGRLRAELGPPNHDLHHIGPDHTMVTVFGTTALGPPTLTVFALFHAFNRAYRWHVLPHDLEGLYLARRTRADMRRFAAALWGAGMFGAVAAFWAYLHIAYQLGMAARMTGWSPLHYGIEAYGRLETQLTAPLPPSTQGMSFIGAGFAGFMLIALVRSQFLSFPLHPLGYAISSGWSMVWLWPSLFIAWLVKALILRYGGLPGYRQALPFFYGLILGEFVVGAGWTFAGLLWGFQPWAFWQA
jgi:uncharacterized protein DUF6785/uncharacterized protein DUF6784